MAVVPFRDHVVREIEGLETRAFLERVDPVLEVGPEVVPLEAEVLERFRVPVALQNLGQDVLHRAELESELVLLKKLLHLLLVAGVLLLLGLLENPLLLVEDPADPEEIEAEVANHVTPVQELGDVYQILDMEGVAFLGNFGRGG